VERDLELTRYLVVLENNHAAVVNAAAAVVLAARTQIQITIMVIIVKIMVIIKNPSAVQKNAQKSAEIVTTAINFIFNFFLYLKIYVYSRNMPEPAPDPVPVVDDYEKSPKYLRDREFVVRSVKQPVESPPGAKQSGQPSNFPSRINALSSRQPINPHFGTHVSKQDIDAAVMWSGGARKQIPSRKKSQKKKRSRKSKKN
jgi:hypothetical protein